MTPADRWVVYSVFPSLFVQHRLGATPDDFQAKYLASSDDEIILLWSRQIGKTTTSAWKVTHRAVFVPKSLSLIVSATQRQAGILQRRVTESLRTINRGEKWREVKSLDLPEDPVDENSRLVRCSVLSLELANGSEVVSVPASPDTVRGYSPNLIILDEAARIPDDVYEAVRPMRAATKAQLVLCSSAAGKRGFFYKAWVEGDKQWTRMEIKAKDCERIGAEFLKRERETLMPRMYAQEYENEFLSLQGAAIDMETMKDMFTTDVKPLHKPVGISSKRGTLIDEKVRPLR